MATPEHIVVKIAGESVFHADIGKVGPNAAISMKKEYLIMERKMAEDEKKEQVDDKEIGIENLKVLENIDVELTVEVGRTEITIRDLLRLNEGSVVELRGLLRPLDILVNNTKIAKGEVVMIGERFGVRFGEIVDPEKRMESI